MYKPIAVRDAAIAYENHQLLDGLRVLRRRVPEQSGVIGMGEMGSRAALLSVNEVGKFGRVVEEEDSCVIGHDISGTLIRSHLDSEPTRITS